MFSQEEVVMPHAKVIIFQSSKRWCELVDDVLSPLTRKDEPEVIVLSSRDQIIDTVMEGGDQLFVTGSVRGQMGPIYRLVGRLKRDNSSLKAALYTQNRDAVFDSRYFDYYIPKLRYEKEKERSCQNLVVMVRLHLGMMT